MSAEGPIQRPKKLMGGHYSLDQNHAFAPRQLQWKLCTELPCHSSKSSAYVAADILRREYSWKPLLSGVYQHGEIISQCTGKVSSACILWIKYKIWWWHFQIHRFLQSAVHWWSLVKIDRKVVRLKASWGTGWPILSNLNGNLTSKTCCQGK